MPRRTSRRPAFTLVEMLVVVVIIGLLLGILVPAVLAGMTKAKNARIALELSQLNAAAIAYRDKYHDLPPDFNDVRQGVPFVDSVAYRHIRKVWQRIDPSELTLIATLATPNIASGGNRDGIDPAEALVFWLGGLSDDPRFPFTGKGGPLLVLSNNEVVVNVDRAKGLFEFKQDRLTTYIGDADNSSPTYKQLNAGAGTFRQAFSRDEVDLQFAGSWVKNDPFPVYLPPGNLTEPYVYLDSRTYSFIYNSTYYQSGYQTAALPDKGGVAPYRSDSVNPNYDQSASNPFKLKQLFYANKDTFQIISAGLDKKYGKMAERLVKNSDTALPPGIPPAGQYFDREDLDNITNFSEGILKDKVQ